VKKMNRLRSGISRGSPPTAATCGRSASNASLPARDVAIIGSGPAGLSAAYHLARKGIRATIFEALPQAGGMLRVGIPEHRLPRKILDQEIEGITRLGVEIKTGTPLGRT